MDTIETIEKKIKQFRVENDLSFEKLSQLTGVSAAQLCYIEKGKSRNPGIRVIYKLSKIIKSIKLDF